MGLGRVIRLARKFPAGVIRRARNQREMDGEIARFRLEAGKASGEDFAG